jgi:FtsH-binding integral membrane protein
MALGPDRKYMTRAQAEAAQIDVGLRQYMLRVYNYMATGLAISGLVAMAIVNTPLGNVFFQQVALPDGRVVMQPNLLGMIGMFAPLAILLFSMFRFQSMSARGAQIMYWAFVATQGISFSLLFAIYTGESLVRVFFITAASFAALSLLGYSTKKNLSAFGSFLFMGVIGLVIAFLVNIFLQSEMVLFIASAIGVLVFAGLTAYDTQRIKNTYYESMGHEVQTKAAVFGALSLYINFINLFQFLLLFLGNRE